MDMNIEDRIAGMNSAEMIELSQWMSARAMQIERNFDESQTHRGMSEGRARSADLRARSDKLYMRARDAEENE